MDIDGDITEDALAAIEGSADVLAVRVIR